jgi:hypothetical protein
VPIPVGRHLIGPEQGRIVLRTYRQGVAASAGHDLVIELARWSGELTVVQGSNDAGPIATGLTARLDLTSLKVLEGVGGIKPLTDRDRREIVSTARKTLSADRLPEAVYTASSISPNPDGGATVTGSLALAGAERPLSLTVTAEDGERYRATAQVVQSEFGIKPYSGFFGALKLRDAVDLEIEVDLSGLGGAER